MELSPLPLAFDLSLTVASRFLHPYSIKDKTPSFIGETILHSQEHLERFTELCRDMKREEREKGDLEEKRESKGEREAKLAIKPLSENGY